MGTLLKLGKYRKLSRKNLIILILGFQVGNFRMDKDGNTMQDKVPAHRSAVYISEVIDGICKFNYEVGMPQYDFFADLISI